MDLLELINQKIDSNQKSNEQRLDRIDANLSEHMRRCDLLEQMNDKNASDIAELKKPIEARKYILNVIKGVSAIAALYLLLSKIL